MRMKIWVLFVFGFMLLTACSNSNGFVELQHAKANTDTPKENESKAENSTQTIKKLKKEIAVYKMEKEYFAIISNLSRDFVQAQKTGNQKQLQALMAKELTLKNKDNGLYVIIDNVDWLLYTLDGKNYLDDWVIQGYDYNKDNQTFNIFIREFYKSNNVELVSPPTFLHLVFKKVHDEWKIVNLEFDV
ncbi:hypothetical protein [Viridibacillus arvi]|uniref:hypothetical protein n=1 Tax=Viridibacillus arvi TaxID=263475 RepID=UPI003D070D50